MKGEGQAGEYMVVEEGVMARWAEGEGKGRQVGIPAVGSKGEGKGGKGSGEQGYTEGRQSEHTGVGKFVKRWYKEWAEGV